MTNVEINEDEIGLAQLESLEDTAFGSTVAKYFKNISSEFISDNAHPDSTTIYKHLDGSTAIHFVENDDMEALECADVLEDLDPYVIRILYGTSMLLSKYGMRLKHVRNESSRLPTFSITADDDSNDGRLPLEVATHMIPMGIDELASEFKVDRSIIRDVAIYQMIYEDLIVFKLNGNTVRIADGLSPVEKTVVNSVWNFVCFIKDDMMNNSSTEDSPEDGHQIYGEMKAPLMQMLIAELIDNGLYPDVTSTWSSPQMRIAMKRIEIITSEEFEKRFKGVEITFDNVIEIMTFNSLLTKDGSDAWFKAYVGEVDLTDGIDTSVDLEEWEEDYSLDDFPLSRDILNAFGFGLQYVGVSRRDKKGVFLLTELDSGDIVKQYSELLKYIR